jgi:very-short-patch-repair endonuclease
MPSEGTSSMPGVLGRFARVVGEPGNLEPIYTRSHVSRHAERMRKKPTAAERELHRILNSLGGGVLRRQFTRQFVVSGRWIVDFFWEVRLAIEVDGSIHQAPDQRELDRKKAADCARFDITLMRVSNSEVFGNRQYLIEKLRDGWRSAKRRENHIIGHVVDQAKQLPGQKTQTS